MGKDILGQGVQHDVVFLPSRLIQYYRIIVHMLLNEPKTIIYRNKFLFFFIFDFSAVHNNRRSCGATDISFAISVSHIMNFLFSRNMIKEIEPGSFDGLEESLIIL